MYKTLQKHQYKYIRGCHICLDFKVHIKQDTVFGVFEDLKFKISEGSDQN